MIRFIRKSKLYFISFLISYSLLISCRNDDMTDIRQNKTTGQIIIRSGSLELIVATRNGLNAYSLRDLKSGQIYADRNYIWSWSGEGFPQLEGAPVIKNNPDSSQSVLFRGHLGAIIVEQLFKVSKKDPGAILESITISNPSDKTIHTSGFRCGFSKGVREGDTYFPDAVNTNCCPIPYRRETNGKFQDFSLQSLTGLTGAEGWVWSNGQFSLLISKFNDDGMEWSLMEPVKIGSTSCVRFGGAGQWKNEHPEGATQLEPGASFHFGETRLLAVAGDWKQAYYEYRSYMEAKGCRVPKGYNPPVHWNELYDNAYLDAVAPNLFKPGWPAANHKRIAYETYSLEHMKGEAAKAKEFGCEALYLDPNWDVAEPPLSTHIWDTERLGTMESFVKTMREDYGLKVSLWCGLAGEAPTYTDPLSLSAEARAVDKTGKRMDVFCVPSPAFLNTNAERFRELCRKGAAFLMFDSNQFGYPCYDLNHGHTIPSTREQHAKGLLRLAQLVKSEYPRTLIEMHDFISGPSSEHYSPTYYLFGQPNSFDCLWGHEFMWNSMTDLLLGKAISLYYYNLAYSIPLYLHVNLKRDNTNAMMFWWYASTCRHLGVGGKSDPQVWEAQKRAMKTYLANKHFFTQGIFYGLDETIHAHTLPDIQESIINVFNLKDKPVNKTLWFQLNEIGLGLKKTRQQTGKELSVNVSIPALGHQLIKISTTPGKDSQFLTSDNGKKYFVTYPDLFVEKQ